MSNLYDNPKYYEIAFSFRNIPAEVDVFEKCFRLFSRIPVKSVLELGCGNSPHMEELIKRGYRYTGLDLSKVMLEYSRRKASRIGAEVNFIHGNLVDFSLETPVDFVYITLGSLCVKNTSELMTHFNSVAAALKKGGLYLLEWCIRFSPPSGNGETWEIEREGIRVKTTVRSKVINPVEQTFEETIVLEVDDHGKHHTISGKSVNRAIYPQEFLCLVRSSKDFDFIGWWNNWDLGQPLEQASEINRPITLLRRV
jgi:SAM-dependent methyltransferase